jgi:stress-induced morphogen
MTTAELKQLLEKNIPEARVQVSDMTGTSDHFEVHVSSPVFAGKSLIEQHKVVHAAVGAHLTTTIHALKIKTSVPSN